MTPVKLLAALAAGMLGCGAADAPGATPDPAAKLYVCAQSDARVEVYAAGSLVPLATIAAGSGRMPHNVTITPDRRWVLATSAHVDGAEPDELLIIDPLTDRISARVELDEAAFIAHVVVAPEGDVAYVSGWGSNLVYRVDLATLTRLPDLTFPGLRRPHGLRLSADGSRLYSANTEGSVSVFDTASGAVIAEYPLGGAAIQVAVGDTAVFASVQSPPALARIDLASGEVASFALPDGAQAPAQILLTPDQQQVLVAEQGDADRSGKRLLVLDAATGVMVDGYEVGLGAHGLALSDDGHTVWVTGLYDGTVSELDLREGRTMAFVGTGHAPNGVALWTPSP